MTRSVFRTAVAISSIFGLSAVQAAEWFTIPMISTADTIVFFDKATVTKGRNDVTVWLKGYRDEESPNEEGIYSMAQKTKFFCDKQVSQPLTLVFYDKKGKVVRQANLKSTIEDVVPGTYGETQLKLFCHPGFPRDAMKQGFLPVEGNDLDDMAKAYFMFRRGAEYKAGGGSER